MGQHYRSEQVKIVQGKGSEITDRKVLHGRAKRKIISQSMALNLVEVAKGNGNENQAQSYWNTYHCQSKLITQNGRAYGKYCKNRYCTLCRSIRKAAIINSYLPIILRWPEPYFVTLTVKAVSAYKLKSVIDSMMQGFRKIKEKHKKKNQRGTGKKLVGIKSMECNFNPKRKTYNPHIHLIVPDQETAELLVSEWLAYSKAGWTNRGAQDMRKVNDSEKVMIEVVKYGSKIFTEPDANNKSKTKGSKIYAAALDNIFSAMKGHRIFDRFGFNLPKCLQPETRICQLSNYEDWVFSPEQQDWINERTGIKLSGHLIPADLEILLKERIDTNEK